MAKHSINISFYYVNSATQTNWRQIKSSIEKQTYNNALILSVKQKPKKLQPDD